VYRANYYGEDVAVKRFTKTEEKSLKVYANEVKILKTCHHPSITRLIGYFEDKQYYYIVCEFVPCGTLSSLIHNKTHQFSIK